MKLYQIAAAVSGVVLLAGCGTQTAAPPEESVAAEPVAALAAPETPTATPDPEPEPEPEPDLVVDITGDWLVSRTLLDSEFPYFEPGTVYETMVTYTQTGQCEASGRCTGAVDSGWDWDEQAYVGDYEALGADGVSYLLTSTVSCTFDDTGEEFPDAFDWLSQYDLVPADIVDGVANRLTGTAHTNVNPTDFGLELGCSDTGALTYDVVAIRR